MSRQNIRIVASRVELPEQFENLAKNKVDLFQGYYFTQPVVKPGQEMDPNRGDLVDLLMQTHQDVNLEKVAERIKKNAALGINLLRLVNGLQLARSQKISSVNQALMMIGAQGLARWLNLLLFAGGDDEGTSSPLFRTAATRGKTMEMIIRTIDGDGAEAKEEAEQAFLVGMLSLVHTLLGMSLEDALASFSLTPDVEQALQAREGRLGQLLLVTERVEECDFDEVTDLLDEIDVSTEQLRVAQIEAYDWVNGL